VSTVHDPARQSPTNPPIVTLIGERVRTAQDLKGIHRALQLGNLVI
jgi:hypothetical protein